MKRVRVLPTKAPGLLNQQKLIKGQTRNAGKALLGPLLQQGGARTDNRFPCSPFVKAGRAGSLHGVRVEVFPGVRLEG